MGIHVTEDDLTNAIFYDAPINACANGDRGRANKMASAMLAAIQTTEGQGHDFSLIAEATALRDALLNGGPLGSSFAGTKTDARTLAREMLKAVA